MQHEDDEHIYQNERLGEDGAMRGDESEYSEIDEVFDEGVEEVQDEHGEPMSEDEEDGMADEDGMGDDYGENENGPIQLDDILFQDDSVQGFFDHKQPVYTVAIHPTLPLVATGGGDDNAFLWRHDTGVSISPLQKHDDSCVAVAFSHDGKYLATGGMDGNIFVYMGVSGAPVCCLCGIDEIVWHPKGSVLIAGGADGSVWMWSLPSGECLNVFVGHSSLVSCGMFTPNGKHIVTASEDGTMIVWCPKTAKIVQKFSLELDGRFHDAAINVIDVDDTSTLILSGAQDGSARMSHIATGKILAHFNQHSDSVEAVAFSNHLQIAATGDSDGSINLWQTHTFHLRQTLKHMAAITKLVCRDAEPWMWSASADRSVVMWDLRTGASVKIWKGHQDCVLDFEVRAVIKEEEKEWVVVSGGDDGVALVFSSTR